MNAESVWLAALSLLGPLTVEITLVVGLAALTERLVVSALWRRTVWQIATLSLAALIVLEITGGIQVASRWLEARAQNPHLVLSDRSAPVADLPQTVSADSPRISDHFRKEVSARLAADTLSDSKSPAGAESDGPAASHLPFTMTAAPTSTAVNSPAEIKERAWPEFTPAAWIGFAWLVGTGVIGAKICLGWILFLFFRCRRRPIDDAALPARVRTLAMQLGLNRTVRLTESRRLAGPIAFGIFHPTIALPTEFTRNFNLAQQDAMLAHELAHLASWDSTWQSLADLVAAVLWWHPLVWWSRRELLAAAETAADEASLVVVNGPSVLAECLVKLGGRLAQPHSHGWVAIEGNGFRSGLGRRVARLMTLRGRSWNPPPRLWSVLWKAFGPVALVALAILGVAWTSPAQFQKGDTMKTIEQTLKRSVATLILVSAVAAENNSGTAGELADPEKPKTNISSTAAPATLGEATPSSPAPQTPTPDRNRGMDPALRARYGLAPASAVPTPPTVDAKAIRASANKETVRSKLERIVLQEVFYDGIPLSEILKDLSAESRKRDADKLGLNFLISNVSVGEVIMDPNTGAPLASGPPVDLNSVLVRFNLSLRHIRLKDVLDVIAKVADHPIHYSIENYGVVFSPGVAPPTETLQKEDPAPTYRMSPELMKRYGLLPPGASTANQAGAEMTANQANSNKDKVRSKLERIILSEVSYDGIPFAEVLKDLNDAARKLDPEKQGLNFIINPNAAPVQRTPVAAFDQAGNRILAPSPEPIVFNNVLVKFNLPLRNVRLKDVLDAITKVATHPIQYSVEDYGVLFSLEAGDPTFPTQNGGTPSGPSNVMRQRYGLGAGPQQPEALEVRTFRVDTNSFLKGLESAFGITLGGSADLGREAAEKLHIELVEARHRFQVGAVESIELEKNRAASGLLQATNDLQEVQIRLRLAEQDVQRLTRMFEMGKASSLDLEKAKAAKEMLALDLRTLESGRSPVNLTSVDPRQRSSMEMFERRMKPDGNLQRALRQVFTQLGVNLDVPGKGVFYNELRGIVLVRATAEDLKIVQAAMETLGSSPQASVKRTVSVLGAVERPGVIDIPAGERLSAFQAIAQVGGFKDTANKNKIEVTRNGRNYIIKIDDLKTATAPETLFWLEPGDMIHVHEKYF